MSHYQGVTFNPNWHSVIQSAKNDWFKPRKTGIFHQEKLRIWPAKTWKVHQPKVRIWPGNKLATSGISASGNNQVAKRQDLPTKTLELKFWDGHGKPIFFFENDLHTVGLPCLCYSSLGSSKNAAIFNRKNGDLTANHWDSTNTYGGCITNRSSGTKNDKLIGHPPNKNPQNECYWWLIHLEFLKPLGPSSTSKPEYGVKRPRVALQPTNMGLNQIPTM